MAKKSSYLSNVLKSIKYATIDNIAEMNPVIVDVYTSNRDFVKETVKGMKGKAEDASSSSKNAFKDTITETYKNLRSDLATGNFYNKARQEQAQSDAMMKAFGMDAIDFGDMGFDDDIDGALNDAFNEDDDFVSDSSDDSDVSEAPTTDFASTRMMNMVMGRTASAVYSSGKSTASALGGIITETSKMNADAIVIATDKLLGGITASSAVIHTDLTVINKNISSIVEFSNEAFRTHIENSTTFFETQKQQMQEQTDILKEILDIQKSVYKPKKKSYDQISIEDLFTGENGLDLEKYIQYLKGTSQSGIASTGDMLAQFGPMFLAGIVQAPLTSPMKALTRKLIPKSMEDTFTHLNDTLSGIISTSLVNLTQAKTGRNGTFFQMLGDLLGLKVPDLKINTANYKKDAVPWSGKDHKALTDVIPTWLSKIYSGITGKQEKRYDYEKGKYVTTEDIKKDYDKEFKYAVARANTSINQEINKMMNKLQFKNEEQRKLILDEINNIQEANFREMKNFNPNSTNPKDREAALHSMKGPNKEKTYEIIRQLYSNIDGNTQLKGSTEMLNSVSRYNKELKKHEAAGDSMYNALFDSSINDYKIMDTPIMASAKRLDVTNSILKDILDAVRTTNNNIMPTATIERTIAKNTSNDGTGIKANSSSVNSKAESTEEINDNIIDITTDDPKKIQEMLENGKDPEVTETYIGSIKNAQTASDKLKAFFKGFALLTKRPAEFLKNTITTVDTYVYKLFFGNGEEDVNSISDKIFKGFDNLFGKIGNKVSGTFNAIKDEIKEEGKLTFNGIFKSIFGKDFNESIKSFKKALFGDENKGFIKGFGGLLKTGMKEIRDDIFGGIKDFFSTDEEGNKKWKTMASEAVDKVQDDFSNKKNKEKSEAEIKRKMDAGEITPQEAAQMIKELHDSAKKTKRIHNAAKGGKVTKTGLVAVSEGERIVPKYMNAASIAGRQLKEKTAIDKYKKYAGLGEVKFTNFATGGTVGGSKNSGGIQYDPNMTYEQFNNFYETLTDETEKAEFRQRFARDYSSRLMNEALKKGIKTGEDAKKFCEDRIDDAIKNNPAIFDEIKYRIDYFANSEIFNKVKRGVKGAAGFAGKMFSEAKSGAKAFTDAFTSDEEYMQNLKNIAGKFTGDKEKGKPILNDIIKNWKQYLPKTIAGGAAGAGFSTMLGLMGGPILGAAVGAGISITTQSEAIQKFLFGEELFDRHGNKKGRAGGVFSKEVSSAIDKYGKDTGRGAIIGSLAGMLPFMPGGPVTGLLIGSALGFAKNNETIQEGLFGSKDWLQKAQKMITKQLPKMGLGSLVGAVAGPFGLTTNLLIGATLGLVSDTETFKNMIFGTKGLNGKRAGGLVGFIKNVTKQPLEGLNKLITDAREFFNNDIFTPLKKAAKPLIRSFENIFLSIGDKIAGTFAKIVWRPIGALLANKVIVPIEKLTGKLFFGMMGIGKSLLKTAIKPITFAGRMAEESQLSRTGMAGGSADDRIIRRQEMIDEYNEQTRNLRGPLKGARAWRRNRRAGKMQDKLLNSESNKMDTMVAGVDNEKLKEMYLQNLSINPYFGNKNTEKATEKFAKGVTVKTKINQLLAAEVANGKLGEKQRNLIIKEIQKGEYKKSEEQIMRFCPMYSYDEKKLLISKIKNAAKLVKEGMDKADKALEANEDYKKTYGFGIAGRKQRRVLEAEMKARGLSLDGTVLNDAKEEEKLEDLKVDTPTDKFLKSIYTDVHGIFEKIVGKPQDKFQVAEENSNIPLDEAAQKAEDMKNMSADEIDSFLNLADTGFVEAMVGYTSNPEFKKSFAEKIKESSIANKAQSYMNRRHMDIGTYEDFQNQNIANTGFTTGTNTLDGTSNKKMEQYQLTENGMVKITTNDQGEWVTDQQDSTTRETEKRRDEKEKTQKGILSKLTGIGSSLVDFFTGDKEEKKPSIFTKILNALGVGFSFLGGSKLGSALKLAGAITGSAYILGHYTRVPETDEDGNPLTDDGGNPIYKTVAGVIGGKIKEIFFGKDGEGGIYHWWTDKAWPVVKNLWLPNIVSWLEHDAMPAVMRGITSAGGALKSFGVAIADWIANDALPKIIAKIPGYLATAAGAFGKAFLKFFGLTDKEVEETGKDTPVQNDVGEITPYDAEGKSSSGSGIYSKLESGNGTTATQEPTSDSNNGTTNDLKTFVDKVNNNATTGVTQAAAQNAQKTQEAQIGETETKQTEHSQSKVNNNQSNKTQTTTTNDQGAIQTKSDMVKAFKASDNYKAIESDIVKNTLVNTSQIYDNWNNPFPGNKNYTYGQVMTTSDIPVGYDENKNILYSQDILKSPTLFYEATGIDVRTKYGDTTTIHYEHDMQGNIPKALLISGITKGQLPSTGLKFISGATNLMYKAGSALVDFAPIPGIAKAAAKGYISGQNLAANAPAKTVELVNNYNKARANGSTVSESVQESILSSLNSRKKKHKQKAKDLSEYVEKLDLDGTGTKTDKKSVMTRLKEWITENASEDVFISTIVDKFNLGVSNIKDAEKITNAKMKQAILKITDKLVTIIPNNFGKEVVEKLGTNMAEAFGTAGVGIIIDVAVSLAQGMKNADANFGVQEPTFFERIISGILNVFCNSFLFGLIEPHDIISYVVPILGEFINLDDLKERQAILEKIVAKWNDEHPEERYSVYSYMMQDKIEAKIDKFLHSRGIVWLTNGVEGIAQSLVGGTGLLLWSGAQAVGATLFGIAGGITSVGEAGVAAISGKDSFGSALGKSFNKYMGYTKDYYATAGDTLQAGSKTFWGGLATARNGIYKTATGKEYGEKDASVKVKPGGDPNIIKNPFNNQTETNTIKDPFSAESTSNTSAQDWANNVDLATMASEGEDKALELQASQLGLSKSDYIGETSDYKDQIDTNMNAVNSLNETWQKIQQKHAPFYASLAQNIDKADSVLSRGLAVYYGLADASDKDADFNSILSDEAYLQKRIEGIQDNSLIANVFSGVTGSNSNNADTQEKAAKKKLQSTNTGKTTGAKKLLNDVLGRLSKLTIGGSGSGVDEPTVSNVNPSEGVFVSQKYGKYANSTFGIGSNKLKVSEAGCAPSTAMMAVNANIGYESPLQMNEALKTASSYISDNGGVTADYFADEFAKHGFKTAYIPKSDKKQKEIMKYQLLNGRSIVLMGKDNSNHSKKKSPFGPNYHYVVATGLSSDGRYVYINDPEAKESNVRYDTDAIFNNTDLTIVPIKTNGRINALSGRLKEKLHKLSGKASGGIIFVGDSRTVGLKQAIGENNKAKFIGKVGEGYSWLSNAAWTSVKTMARSNSDFSIVFNFGVNDLDNIDKYIEFYNSVVKPELGDRVYFMSVNPTKDPYKGAANNSAIEKFNTKYKAFAGNKYIDTYTYLNTKGFQSPDGLHYDTQTYKDIYNFTVDAINGTGNSLDSSTNLGGAANSISGTTATGSTKSIKTIGDLISAIGSILAGSWGLSSSDTNYLTGSSSGTKSTTGSVDGTSGRVSSNKIIAKQQEALVNKMKSIEGKIAYSMTGPRDPDQGSADCSSTVQWAYKNVTGKDIGSWTGAQEQSSETTFVDQPHMSREFDESKLQLGDILLYGQNAGSHVEMYAGNGKVIGHGGPGNGPIIRDISSVHQNRNDRWSAKRLASFASGKGSGIFVSQKASKWANKRIGDEKVSEAGCAPAVATMAISNDNQYNMTQAINDAKDYKDKGGGVSADYFVDVFKKQGYNCLVISDKKKIINALKKGNNAVLIGRDLTNTSKKKSPFGPTDHYVLAVGISKNGKYVYINDPEATEPNIEYKTNIVMSGVRVAIIPVTINNSRMKDYSKSLGDALSNFVGRAATTNNTAGGTSSSSILSQCAKFQTQLNTDIKKGIKWTRSTKADNLAEDWSRAKTQKHTSNALLFIRWALREAGLLSKMSGRFNPSTNGDITFTGTAKDELGKQFDIISVKSKTVNQMVASGDLKPGDIVSYVSFNHMNIYAGNGKWYDAGSAYCKGSTEGSEYTSWMGNTKYGNQYVGTIMRKKAASNTATGGTATNGDTIADNSSVSLDGTGYTDSTENTTGGSSSGTILDQLTNAFADLAAAWGLSSNSSDEANIDSGSDSSGGTGGSATAVTGSDAKAKVWNYLHNKGIPDNGIAGAMGNMQNESGIEFNRVESDFSADRSASKQYTNDVNSGAVSESAFVNNQSPRSSWPHINGHEYGPGYGLVQWTSSGRKQGLYNLAKKNNASIDDPQTSMDWLWQELQSSSYAPTLNAMKEGSSVRAVSDVFLHNFESPADQSESVQQSRAQAGTTILQQMTGKGSGLSVTGINRSANSAIKSINRANKGKSITTVRNLGSIMGKGSGLDDNNGTTIYSPTDSTIPIYSANITRNQVAVDSKSSIDTNALLNAIIKLLTQEVKNTASIQGIADAIVTLVDSKVNSETDVSTKKQLLDTKQQVLSLVRTQNNSSASTSLNDLITSVESITTQ